MATNTELLQQILEEQKKTNELLEKLRVPSQPDKIKGVANHPSVFGTQKVDE
jgi:hypothetical protein